MQAHSARGNAKRWRGQRKSPLDEKFFDPPIGEGKSQYHPIAQVITAGSKWRHLNNGGRDLGMPAAYQTVLDPLPQLCNTTTPLRWQP